MSNAQKNALWSLACHTKDLELLTLFFPRIRLYPTKRMGNYCTLASFLFHRSESGLRGIKWSTSQRKEFSKKTQWVLNNLKVKETNCSAITINHNESRVLMAANLVPVNRGRRYQELAWPVRISKGHQNKDFIYFVTAIKRSDLGNGQCQFKG